MSRLARRVALAALAVLTVQFLAALAIQVALSHSLRGEVVRQLVGGIEASGALAGCAERPGPWEHPEGWWTAWPLSASGEVVGPGAEVASLRLPAPGQLAPWSAPGRRGAVYASPERSCGGLLLVQRSALPFLASQSSTVGMLALLRLALVVLAALALVAVTALPLVRRVRALSKGMAAVVAEGFRGTVADGARDELGEVAEAFDAATATARERLERLTQRDAVVHRALADLAHDLRTPLATLKLSASSLPSSAAAHTIRSELDFLESMTERFEALVERQDEGAPAPVALEGVAQRLEHRFAPLAEDRGLVFELALPDETLVALADAVALERAVGNLVQNAFRFSNGRVALLLFREGDEVRLEVRDDGPGFGDLSGRAAERGVRGDASGGEGHGFGLAIAEATARRFGGRLELLDAEEGGALVALVLPRATTPQGEA